MSIPLNISPLGFTSAAVEPSELPAGYTRLAFIQNNGANSVYYQGTKSDKNTVYSGRFLQKNTAGGFNYIFCTYYSGWGVEQTTGDTARMFFCTRMTDDSMLISRTTPNEFYADVNERVMNGVSYPPEEAHVDESYTSDTMTIFGFAYNIQIASITQIWWLKYLPYLDLLPCVTPDGYVAFFNKIDQTTKRATHGTGELVGGLETLAQLTALASNMPTVTDTPEINLSLPGEWNGDASANAQLSIITGKGWSTSITYRDVEASTSSSYVLGNRGDGGSALVLWCRAVESEYGNYQDADGVRYYVETCHDIWHPQELSPDDLGYTAVLTLEDYLTELGLTAVVYEEDENFTTN